MHQIEHVVVLMMENRSFDQMTGWLPVPGLDGLATGSYSNRWNGSTYPATDRATGQLPLDPHHSYDHVAFQLMGAPGPLDLAKVNMSGFVEDAQHPGVIDAFDPRVVPVLSTLASQFVICDRWFSSVPGQTWPNRNFSHAGHSDGMVNNRPYKLYGMRTIFQVLRDAGASWAIYSDGFPQVAVFWKLVLRHLRHFRDVGDFLRAVRQDRLPAYAFIEPRHFRSKTKSNSQHPANNEKNSRDFFAGEQLIRDVYTELTSNHDVWKKVLLVITYDEHGGFFDHVRPERTISPGPGAALHHSFKFDVTGVRVPTVLVSPWLPAGHVDHTIYDHASIPKSIRARFATGERPLSAREDAAADWWHLLQSTMRDDIPSLPDVSEPFEPFDARAAIAEETNTPASDDELDAYWAAQQIDGLMTQQATNPEIAEEYARLLESPPPQPALSDLATVAGARQAALTVNSYTEAVGERMLRQARLERGEEL